MNVMDQPLDLAEAFQPSLRQMQSKMASTKMSKSKLMTEAQSQMMNMMNMSEDDEEAFFQIEESSEQQNITEPNMPKGRA